MAFLPSQLTTLLFLAVAASSTAGMPYFEGYYQPAFYYPNVRYSRSAPAASAASTSGAASYAGSAATSSSGTHVAPGPGGSGAFNAFAGTGPAGDFGATGFGGPTGFGYGYGAFPGFAFPSFDFNSFYQQFQEAQRKAQEAAASSPGSNEISVGATAGGEYGPSGGYGGASVYPGAPQGLDLNFGGGLDDRFGGGDGAPPVNSVSGSFVPPGGSSYGVFTSSSSHMSNVDGKVSSHKTATVGINDNGKITTYTAHDP